MLSVVPQPGALQPPTPEKSSPLQHSMATSPPHRSSSVVTFSTLPGLSEDGVDSADSRAAAVKRRGASRALFGGGCQTLAATADQFSFPVLAPPPTASPAPLSSAANKKTSGVLLSINDGNDDGRPDAVVATVFLPTDVLNARLMALLKVANRSIAPAELLNTVSTLEQDGRTELHENQRHITEVVTTYILPVWGNESST